jgi:dTMP kinase
MPFIVFEGLDGSGKSTLMDALQGELQSRCIAFVRTREPGGTELGDEIRQMILRTKGPSPNARTELLLYEASRSQHVDQVILPSLQQKKWVLCDRFTASSVAFQAGGRNIDAHWVEKLNDFATQGLQPDLTVLLDLTVEESRRRRHVRSIQNKSEQDRMELEADSFHERVRRSFLDLGQNSKKESPWLVLPASHPPGQLLQILLDHLKESQWL